MTYDPGRLTICLTTCRAGKSELLHPNSSSAPSPSQASRTDVETRANQGVANRSDEEVGHIDSEEPHSEVIDELVDELLAVEETGKVAPADHEEPSSVVVEELVVDEDDVVKELPNEDQDSGEIIPSSPAAPACNT